MIKLPHRLQIIADNIENNSKVIDIGCDHAYLSIYLAQNKQNIKVISSDINENAYNIALANIKKQKLEKIISTRLGNGLEVVEKDEIDTIIISGLGSMTIVSILKNGYDKLKSVHTLVIQSNTDLYYLRKNITKLNYYIKKEQTIKEKGIYYTIITFKKGYHKYSNNDLHYGPLLIKKEDKIYIKKLEEDYSKLKRIFKNIPPKKFILKLKIFIELNKIKRLNQKLK